MNILRKFAVATILAGSLATSFAQYDGTWVGGAASQNWSNGTNWFGGHSPTTFDKVYFEDVYGSNWTNQIGAVNNVVDVNTAVATLYYTAYAVRFLTPHYYTTQINPGVTLTVGGPFGAAATTFAVGDIPSDGLGTYVGTFYTNYTMFTGQGTLFVNDANGTFTVGGGFTPGTILDMTNLFTFNANVRYFYKGASSDNPFASAPFGNLFLARTNNITTTASGGTAPGVLFGSIPSGLPTQPSSVVLGAVNNFNTDALVVGGGNSTEYFTFTNYNTGTPIPDVPNGRFAQNTGTFKLRGSAGGLSRASIFSVGDAAAKPGTMSTTLSTSGTTNRGAIGTADFRNGTVDIMVDKLVIGHGPFDGNINGTFSSGGFLFYDNGNVDANNVYLAYEQGTNSCNAQGLLLMVGNATMTVNNNFYMAFVPDKANGLPTGTFATNIINDNAVLNIGGNLQHGDGTFQGTNSSSTLLLGGGTVNMFNIGNVSLYNLQGFGTISNAFSIMVSNGVNPGLAGPGNFGNLNLYGNLSLLGQFPITFDIGTVTNKGAPYNDLISVTGDLNVNSNQIVINYNGTPAVGKYRLIEYTGTKTGTLRFTNDTRSAVSLDQSTAGVVQLVISNWTPGNLTWNGVTNVFWTAATTAGGIINWGAATNQTFLAFDAVRFDDSVTTNASGNRLYTNLCQPVGFLFPSSIYITNNKYLLISNAPFGQIGAIMGTTGVTKDGTGVLSWSAGGWTNYFTGDWHINAGVVETFDPKSGSQTLSGRHLMGSGNIYVTNGATLNLINGASGAAIGVGQAVYISGTGFPNYTNGPDGVLFGNKVSGPNQPGYNLRLRLAGDAAISTTLGNLTFSGTANAANDYPPFMGELSLNGYTLTVQGTNTMYFALQDLANTDVGNIKMLSGSPLRLSRAQLTGGGTLTLTNLGAIDFNLSSAPSNNIIAKSIVATNLAFMCVTQVLGGPYIGTNFITGTVAVDDAAAVSGPFPAAGWRGILVSNDMQAIEFDNAISGTAGLTKMGVGPLVLNAANSYQGTTIVNGGSLILGPSGTIPSTVLTLNPGAAAPTTTLDVSSTPYALASGKTLALNGVLPGDVAVNGNLTLNSGSVLFGVGTFNGNLTAANGSEVAPGGTNNQGQFVVNGNLALQGAHLTWDVTPSFATSDGIVVNGNLNLSGVTTFMIDSIGGFSPNSTNTLITYTGARTGGLPNLAINNPNVRFGLTLVDPATTPGKIQVVLTSPPGNLTWTGTDATHPTYWDLKNTTNWLNAGTNDIFWAADYVTFDQSGASKVVDVGGSTTGNKPMTPGTVTVSNANYTFQGTNGLITSSLLVSNGATLVLSNRQDNQMVGTGTFIAGGSTLFMRQPTNVSLYSDLQGSGTFEKGFTTNSLKLVGDASQWTGTFNVNAGTLTVGQDNAVNNTVNVNAGGALDISGHAIAGASVTASGVGPDGNGAINNRLNVSTNLLNWSSNAVTSLTLGGDTTIGAISNAWGIMSLQGNGYNLTKTNANDIWIATGNDTGLGNITIAQGRLIFEGIGTGLGLSASNIYTLTNQTLAFANTNYGGIVIGNFVPAWQTSSKVLNFGSNANFMIMQEGGGPVFTNTFSGPISFTNDLKLMGENPVAFTYLGNMSGPAPSTNRTFGSLIISNMNQNSAFTVGLFGTNTYASNTWVAGASLYISNQIAIPTNTSLILSNANALSPVQNQLFLLGGSQYAGRNLRLSSSNQSVRVSGSATWFGTLSLYGTKGFDFNASATNGGLDLAFTNIVPTNVAAPVRFGGNTIRLRPSMNMVVNPGVKATSGTMQIGANISTDDPENPNLPRYCQVQFDNTNNWFLTSFDQGRINWNTNNVLPPGAQLNVSQFGGGCLMDLHGFSQTLSHIRDNNQQLSGTNAIVNDSTNADSTLTLVGSSYSQTNGFTNCTALMLSASTNAVSHHLLNLAVTGGFTELLNTNTYDGVTTVSGGKLLLGNYSVNITNFAATNTVVYSGTLVGTPSVTVSGTGIFGGNGFVGAPVIINSGGTLLPGECLTFQPILAGFAPAVVTRTGQLTFGNTSLTLGAGGYVLFNADNTTNQFTGAVTNASIAGLSSVTYGGTLIVSNVSSVPFTNNQVLKLFNAGSYNGSFSSVLVWGALNGSAVDTSGLATNGTIKILTAVGTSPVKIGVSRPNKNTLSLSWPADHLGWRLQVMTNSLATGMLTNSYVVLTNITGVSTNITTNVVQLANWVDCANGQNITSTNVTIGTTNVIFRLKYP